MYLFLTLNGPLEEGLAGLAGGHAVVVAGRHIATHQTNPFGHGAQHELTLHGAFFFTEPSRRERKGRDQELYDKLAKGLLFEGELHYFST